MNEIMSKTIEKIVSEQINNDYENIQNALFDGTTETMSAEKIYSVMLLNSMKLSVNISVQIITDMLVNACAIEIADENTLRRILLSSVKEK